MEVLFDNRQEKIEIGKEIEELIKNVIIECLQIEGKNTNYEVSVSFVDNDEIRLLNRDYRGNDKPTDVLSFPMEEDEDVTNESPYTPLLGDIVISTEKAIEQSKEYGHSFQREIAYLTAHSMFHLMGYDHETPEDKKVMREKEKEVMKKIGIFKNS